MHEATWYRRLGDIPGLRYHTPEGICPPSVPEESLNPELYDPGDDESPPEWLWPCADGQTNASPAMRMLQQSHGSNPLDFLRQIRESLELPGTAHDYDGVLTHACNSLAEHARRQPELIEEVEQLSLLNLNLLEAMPEVVRQRGIPTRSRVRIPAVHRLVKLYEQNGLLDEALIIARRGVALGMSSDDVDRVEARIATMQGS